MTNILLCTDFYKHSHWKQYPPGTTEIYSYLESRGGDFNKIRFFGLQYILKKYLTGKVVTREKIDQAKAIVDKSLGAGVFNLDGWNYILEKYDGKLPLEIKSVQEGTVIDRTGQVLMTIRNTDPNCFWLTNFVESLLLQVWYPTTVATLSYHMKELIDKYIKISGSPESSSFKLVDFGYRGSTSDESAAIGGAAHLINFRTTDNIRAISLLQEYYNIDNIGVSIPASEHSTIISWGNTEQDEYNAYNNMLDKYPDTMFSCVSDSYDIYNACSNIWGNLLKDKVLSRKPEHTVVIRPDSGDPVETCCNVLNALTDKFGYTTNEKGFKVLPPQVRVIYGDGINLKTIEKILHKMTELQLSVDNIVFGCGGGLLQNVNRDTCRFAIKASSITINGQEKGIFKNPKTSDNNSFSKESKAGKLGLYRFNGTYFTAKEKYPGMIDLLSTSFLNGECVEKTICFN